jgi:hypothetical protein
MFLYLLTTIAINSWATTPKQNQIRDFYRSPLSTFQSGQASYDELLKKRSSAQTIKLNLVEIGKYQEWIPASHLYTIQDFQYTSISPMSAYAKTNAIIYKKINGNWTPYERIKKGSRFQVEQMTSGWACGNLNREYVCLANDQIVMAIDLAKKIHTKDGKTYDFTERREDQIITKQNSKILWQELKSWTASSEVALIKNVPSISTQGKLSPFERVELKEHKLQYWVESIYGTHGKVWWLMNNKPNVIDENSLILSTNEIKERGIFDWSTNRNSLALVSANGIFISQEKDTWKYISKFGEANHAVAVGLNKTLFVGDQYSTDGGNNFEPYIRWDILSSLIQEELGTPPSYIKITKIYIPNEKQKNVHFQIETGRGNLTFSTHLQKQSLHIIKR